MFHEDKRLVTKYVQFLVVFVFSAFIPFHTIFIRAFAKNLNYDQSMSSFPVMFCAQVYSVQFLHKHANARSLQTGKTVMIKSDSPHNAESYAPWQNNTIHIYNLDTKFVR
jgi:hypothetical protein